MTLLAPCVEQVTHLNFMVAENGRRANFKNPTQSVYRKIKIDSCLINNGERCDWLVTKVGVGAVFVELKGRDVKKAYSQILATIARAECVPWLEAKVALLIVCSKYPAFDTIIAQKAEDARKRGLRVKVVCNQADVVIEKLLGLAGG